MAWYIGLIREDGGVNPWSSIASPDVVNEYNRDISWMVRCYEDKQPFVGTVPGRQRRQNDNFTVLGKPRTQATHDRPELSWILTNPPEKDANGIPIPTTYLHKKRDIATEYMVINGRRMRWDGTKYVPMARVKARNRWRRSGVPVDTKLFHGPHLPKARVLSHSLTDRIRSLQGPVISFDLSDATPDESVDLLDLLEAFNV